MSPEQLKVLQRLSQLFEEGNAGPSQIKELSRLLAVINQNHEQSDLFQHTIFTHSRSNTDKV
jgi:hypothetical protein